MMRLSELPVLPLRYQRPATRRRAEREACSGHAPASPLDLRRLASADCNDGGGRQRVGGGDRSLGTQLPALPGRDSEARPRCSTGRRARARLRKWRRWEPRCALCARSCASCATPLAVPIATVPPIATCSRPSGRTG